MLAKQQRPFPNSAGTLTRDDWRGSLGNLEALPAFRRMFAGEVAARGVGATLRTFLPALMPGLAAAEFHCMIRTAYGVRFGDPEEVAIGLAYWSAAFMPLGTLGAAGTGTDPTTSLRKIRGAFRSADLTLTFEGGGKADAMKAASRLPGFQAAACQLAINDDSLAAIARAMLQLFVVPGRDVLHTVTGTHAYRTLEPFLPVPSLGRRYLWQSLVAYYLSEGVPDPAAPPPPTKLPEWSEIIAAARAKPDDHGVKITHTAIEEYRAYQDVRYIEVAARRWGLL
jgi:hypothetical protein